MRIELFGIARARARREIIDLEAATLGEAVFALAEACPGLVPEVLADGRLNDLYLASLNGERFVSDPGTPIGPDDALLIVGAQTGG